mgnify:CR=1 FL=1
MTQEEQHRKLMGGREDKSDSTIAFAVNHGMKVQTTSERVTCKHCGKYGHEDTNCYEIIGYPQGWGSRGRGRGGRAARGGRGGAVKG